jgi:hypothetical protein
MSALATFIAGMPKAELHLHLEGNGGGAKSSVRSGAKSDGRNEATTDVQEVGSQPDFWVTFARMSALAVLGAGVLDQLGVRLGASSLRWTMPRMTSGCLPEDDSSSDPRSLNFVLPARSCSAMIGCLKSLIVSVSRLTRQSSRPEEGQWQGEEGPPRKGTSARFTSRGAKRSSSQFQRGIRWRSFNG